MNDGTETRRATLADFQRKSYVFNLVSPFGETLEVELRALTPDEVISMNFATARPKAPTTDFKKEDGVLYPVYDHQDSGYLKSLETWATNSQKRLVALAMVSPELPGETLDEKVSALGDIEGWALSGLNRAVNMLLSVGADAVRLRTFQRDGELDT